MNTAAETKLRRRIERIQAVMHRTKSANITRRCLLRVASVLRRFRESTQQIRG